MHSIAILSALTLFTGLVAAFCAVPASAGQEESQAAILTSIGSALQGNSAKARADLLAIDDGDLDREDKHYRQCMLERFAPAASPVPVPDDLPPLARGSLSAFREYWQAMLTGAENSDTAEDRLRKRLQTLLRSGPSQDINDLSNQLNERLRDLGLGSLQGRTGALREFMLWRDERIETENVTLPEEVAQTQVHYLRGFASLGWADYSTCGRRGAGGWTANGSLYAVVPRYKSLEGEEFRVTFLGHETQHFVDLLRWPELAPWHLEYRAKLVELAQTGSTRPRILRKFAEDRSDNPELPHSFANSRVIADMLLVMSLGSEAQLRDVPDAKLNLAAASLLREDSARLRESARKRSTKPGEGDP